MSEKGFPVKNSQGLTINGSKERRAIEPELEREEEPVG